MKLLCGFYISYRTSLRDFAVTWDKGWVGCQERSASLQRPASVKRTPAIRYESLRNVLSGSSSGWYVYALASVDCPVVHLSPDENLRSFRRHTLLL